MSNTVYYRKEGLITADMDGEPVMMDIEPGKYYHLGSFDNKSDAVKAAKEKIDDIVDDAGELIGKGAEEVKKCGILQKIKNFFGCKK